MFKYNSVNECPDKITLHEKTFYNPPKGHVQAKCPTCGFWACWERDPTRDENGFLIYVSGRCISTNRYGNLCCNSPLPGKPACKYHIDDIEWAVQMYDSWKKEGSL